MDGDAVERTRAQVAAYVGMGGHEGADAGDLATYLLVEEPQFQRSIRDVLYTEEIQSGGRFIDTGHHLRPDLVTAEDGDVRIRPDVYAAWCDSMMKMGYSAEEAEVLVDGFGVEVAKERIVSEVERHGYPADEAEQLVAQGAVKVRGDPPVLLVDETARDAEADSTQQSFWDQLMAE